LIRLRTFKPPNTQIINIIMTDPVEVAAVALKLPIFWTERAEVWFAQAEAQFITKKVTSDETRFYHIVQALDQETATRVLDLLRQPPAADKYAILKRRLLDSFTLSESQRAGLLLNMPGLGDSRPSQLMDKMLALLGDHKPCFLFREIFMQQLPVHIRAHLIQAKITDCRAMALAADALATAAVPNINLIHSKSHRGGSKTEPTSARTPSARVNTNYAPRPVDSDICFFHHRFGDAARQCRPPCNYTAKGNGQAGRQ